MWRAKAEERYPASTLLLEHYGSYQVLCCLHYSCYCGDGCCPSIAEVRFAWWHVHSACCLPRSSHPRRAPPGQPYDSFKQELVRDDNSEHATLLLRFDDLSSRYNFSRHVVLLLLVASSTRPEGVGVKWLELRGLCMLPAA